MPDKLCSICGERLVSSITRIVGDDYHFCVTCEVDLVTPRLNMYIQEIVAAYQTEGTTEYKLLQYRRSKGISFDPQAASKA